MGIKRSNVYLGCFCVFIFLMIYYISTSWSGTYISCSMVVKQRGPCRQERQKYLLESCNRLHINKTDPAPAYRNMHVNEQSKLLICGSQDLAASLGVYGKSLAPFSSFTDTNQEEMLKTYRRVLVVRHPLVRVLNQYKASRYIFPDYVQMMLESHEDDKLIVENECLPCSAHYHYIVKYESLSADLAYISASMAERNDDTCTVSKPPDAPFYREVLPEYDDLNMKELSQLLLRFSDDIMLFDYQWKMNVGGKGITVMSDGTLLKCK